MKYFTLVLLSLVAVSSAFFNKRQLAPIGATVNDDESAAPAAPAVPSAVVAASDASIADDDDVTKTVAASNVAGDDLTKSVAASSVADDDLTKTVAASNVADDDLTKTVAASNVADDDDLTKTVAVSNVQVQQPDSDAEVNADDSAPAAPAPVPAVSNVQQPGSAVKVSDDDATAASVSDDATKPASTEEDVETVSSPSTIVVLEEDYNVYEPFGMMDGGFNYYYGNNYYGDGNYMDANSTSVVRVAVLDNVFYFTKATTLIEDVESMLAYEEQLFNSKTFDEYLEQQSSSDYQYISLGPKSTKAASAA